MKLKKNLFTGIFLLITGHFAYGQFTVNGEFRSRGEVRHGYSKLPVDGSDAAFFVSQRSRISFGFTNDLFKTKLTLQNINVWGDDNIYTGTGAFGSTNGVDVYESWLELKTSPTSVIRIGRQELAYDDQRILSTRDWTQSGLTYDALVFKKQGNSWGLDIGLSLNNKLENTFGNDFYTDKNRIKTLNFAHFDKKVNEKFKVSLIALGTGYQKEGTTSTIYMTGTYGTNLNYNFGSVTLSPRIYYQNGKNKKGEEISAYYTGVDLSASPGDNFMITAGVDYFSGHDASNSDTDYMSKDHTFDLMYGARYKFYGNMNQFVFSGEPIDNGGLSDIYLKFKYSTGTRGTFLLDYHYFRLTSNYADPTYTSGFRALNKSLGSEFDIIYSHELFKGASIKTGFSFFLPSESLEILKGVGAGNSSGSYWGWIMVTIKPGFFNSKGV